MKNYKITIGTGTMYTESFEESVEDFQYEQDAVDQLIDKLEEQGDSSVISIDQAEKDLSSDEYVIGGNHGLALTHYGTFYIKEVL